MTFFRSTSDNPLGFFDYLLLENGIVNEKYIFIHSHDEHECGPANYDFDQEILHYRLYISDLGEVVETSMSFEENLRFTMEQELERSKKLIDEIIIAERDFTRLQGFVVTMANKLFHLLNNIPDSQTFRQSELLTSTICNLYNHLISTNVSFNNVVAPEIQKRFDEIKTSNKELRTFQWIREPKDGLIEKLWKFLTDNEYIDSSTSKITFEGVFSDVPISTLAKIKWIDIAPRSKAISLSTLFCLFDSLIESGYISKEQDNMLFLTKLSTIFIDKGGQSLKLQSLKSSRATSRRSKNGPSERHELITEFITNLT